MEFRNYKDIQVGDVIRSPRFVFGRVGSSGEPIAVGMRCRYWEPSTETQIATLPDGRRVPVEVQADPFKFDRSDETRRIAHFLVEGVRMQGGYTDLRGDRWPDGKYVAARRLNADGTYNSSGERIGFYMSGVSNDKIEIVTLTGRMKQVFVREY